MHASGVTGRAILATSVFLIQFILHNTSVAQELDVYKFALVPAGAQLNVSGHPGSVNPLGILSLQNVSAGGDFQAVTIAPDGSFASTLPGQAGDVIRISVDGPANGGAVLDLHASAVTIKNPNSASSSWFIGQSHVRRQQG